MLSGNRVERAREVITSVLGTAYPAEARIRLGENPRYLFEVDCIQHPLAEAVLGVNFPRIVGPIELDHYTSLEHLRGIVESKELRLLSVSRYIDGGEFEAFARDHGLDGYLTPDVEGKKCSEELSKDLFYLSMTSPGSSNEKTLWKRFARDGRGVRLRLRVTPKPPADLRKMSYDSNGPTALKLINDSLAKDGLTYLPWSVSRICAFYLPTKFSAEDEVRLLLKRHDIGPNDVIESDGVNVWPIPLAPAGETINHGWCEIELIGIKAGRRCGVEAIQHVLAGTPYSAVQVTD